MAYEEELADRMRDHLAAHPEITEQKMFGGLCFMLRGNMLCGVHKDGVMFRVGKDNQAAAQAIDGVREAALTGRPMGGLVEADAEIMEDVSRVSRLMDLALDFVAPMPAK